MFTTMANMGMGMGMDKMGMMGGGMWWLVLLHCIAALSFVIGMVALIVWFVKLDKKTLQKIALWGIGLGVAICIVTFAAMVSVGGVAYMRTVSSDGTSPSTMTPTMGHTQDYFPNGQYPGSTNNMDMGGMMNDGMMHDMQQGTGDTNSMGTTTY